jgi:hypothetical protein
MTLANMTPLTTHTSMEPFGPTERNWHHTQSNTNWHQSQRMKKMVERKKKREVESSLKRSGYLAPMSTVLSKVMTDRSWTRMTRG